MNALPVAPEQLDSTSFVRRYFRDMKRWSFDIAYTGVYAHSRDHVLRQYRQRYMDFARMAHDNGYPACVQVQATLAPVADVPISEAQIYRDGRPDDLGNGSFFASFASRVWRDFLAEITGVFFTEYGYDWVVFEEPMYRVDVPGASDRFWETHRERFPDLKAPSSSADTPAYRLIQELKAETLTGFLREMLSRARDAGASRAGVMPWFFIPTIENTPAESLNTSCDIGQIVGLPELGFVVVRMQPDNISANVMRTGDETQTSPLLYYPEVMAHQLGKPVIAVNNPCDEHTDDPSCPLLPLDFFQRATLASLAAAPNGLTRHWYGYQYGEEREHMRFFRQALRVANRLGNPKSSIAFVFSHSGGRHGLPYTYEQIWRRWWAFGREMMLEKLYPVLTLWASDLKRQLAANTELRLLVLSSAFPLTQDQMGLVEEWLAAEDGRGLAVFAESPQLSADPERAGHVPLEESFPGLHRLLGFPWPSALDDEKGRLLLAMAPESADSFARAVGLGVDSPPILALKARRSEPASTSAPGRSGSTLVVLPNGPIDMPEEICRFVRGVATHCGAPAPVVRQAHVAVLWNETRAGYVVLANTARTPSEVLLRTRGARVWDVVRQKLFCADAHLRLPPFSFRLVRLIEAGDALLDVDGQMYIESITREGDETIVWVLSRGPLRFLSRSRASEVAVDGRAAPFSSTEHPGYHETTVEMQGVARREVRIVWAASEP